MDRPKPKSGTAGDPIEFVPRERYLEARHRGAYSHEAYKTFIARCMDACGEHGMSLLFVDITSLTGFHPNAAQRFEMGSIAAKRGNRLDRIAILGTPEQVEQQFGTLVARNRGLNVQAFTDRDEALRWLIGSDGPKKE
jgi:hypothetical protein